MAKQTQEKLDKTLEFIKNFVKSHGFPPTVREICSAIGVKSSATAQYYLDKLEQAGKIRRLSTKNRAIELILDEKTTPEIEPLTDFIMVPLVGKVAAGMPILATENIEDHLALPTTMFNRSNTDLFALNVTGDSMINAGILNGDKIVVRRQQTAKNGDIVVALIDDSATVKRFYKEKDVFRLQPENDYMSPIFVKELDILGIVVGLIRKF